MMRLSPGLVRPEIFICVLNGGNEKTVSIELNIVHKRPRMRAVAATMSDPLRASYVEMTKRWREMADQTEAIDRVVADKRKPQ